MGEPRKGIRALLGKYANCRFVIWWNIAWAIGVMALSPLVNVVTPFLQSSYANQWTPDVFWRLVLYWHGGIFVPWVTILAILVGLLYGLDKMGGASGRLYRESVLYGGLFAAPIAGVAGIFDVYDHFALGAPLWLQIGAFLIADEMALSLLLAMFVYPRVSGRGYLSIGLPYYTIFLGVIGALVAALMGHIGGWISWFGPSPPVFAQYINSTMYPVLGYYNTTAVITFTENTVGSHSHLMLISLMAGVVALTAASFNHDKWAGGPKAIARMGFAIILVTLAGAIAIYVISGVGNYATPTFFVSGANGLNGVAADDMITGLVGFGAAFVLVSLLLTSRTRLAGGARLLADPLFLSLVFSWLLIYLVIPITGFFINFNEEYFQTAGISFDDAFVRFHQDFGFFLMPTLVTLVLGLNAFGITGSVRRRLGTMLLVGEAVAFAFGELYTLFWLSPLSLYAASFGGVLMGIAAIQGVLFLRTKVPSNP
jgi:hypothetical protein